MDYRGDVQGGVVVLDDEAMLPDGTPVTIRVDQGVDKRRVGQELEKLAGLADLPPDIAEKHDQYRRERKAG